MSPRSTRELAKIVKVFIPFPLSPREVERNSLEIYFPFTMNDVSYAQPDNFLKAKKYRLLKNNVMLTFNASICN